MAKKINIKNVNLDSGELNPVTLGYLNSKKKAPFLILIVFGILVPVAYFMPQISNYINKYINPEAYREYLEQKQSKDIIDERKVVKAFNKDTTITIGDLVFSNFAFSNNSVTFTINDPKLLNNHYLKTYDENKNLLETLNIGTNGAVPVTKTNISFISIEIIDDFNEIDKLENSITVTCKKDYESYAYTFVNLELTTVVFKSDMTKSEVDSVTYYGSYNTYYNESAKEPVEGISKYFSNKDDGFFYSVTYDLSKALAENITDENVFAYKVSKDTVAIGMSGKGYNCN